MFDFMNNDIFITWASKPFFLISIEMSMITAPNKMIIIHIMYIPPDAVRKL
jgi:hypothetical protein